jgi:hypothetical protein
VSFLSPHRIEAQQETARCPRHIKPKKERLPAPSLFGITGLIGDIAIPYGNELWRCRRGRAESHFNQGCLPSNDLESPTANPFVGYRHPPYILFVNIQRRTTSCPESACTPSS